MADETKRDEVRIRWLVAGRFTQERSAGAFAVAPAQLDRQLAERVPSVRVSVPDRIGALESRSFELAVRGLRSFTLAGVVEGVPELLALSALGARGPDELVAEVERIAGPGRLLDACRTAGARSAVEAAVYGTALDALRAEPLRSLEASWRGLRLLLSACPARSGLEVRLLDAAPGELPALLGARPESDGFDEPDALFVADELDSFELLAGLADAADGALAPCVVGVAPRLFGAGSVADLAARAALSDEWRALRDQPPARWLCAAVNPLALFSEGAGAFRRTAFGSPVWALAAMLSASWRADGSLARIVGRPGALEAPAAWTLPGPPHAGERACTEAVLTLAEQGALAAQGLAALGSVRGADQVALAAAPMAGGDLPLPAQLLAGRIVRFARWTRRQLDPSLPPQEASAIFQQAAQLFLLPGLEGAAALGAEVLGEAGHRVLHVAARVAPSRALAPLAIEFELPM